MFCDRMAELPALYIRIIYNLFHAPINRLNYRRGRSEWIDICGIIQSAGL